LPQKDILLGVIGRPHGVRGHVRVHSYTSDPVDLVAYGTLHDDQGRPVALRWVGDGVAEISEFSDAGARLVADRSSAERWVNRRLYVDRDTLPAPEPDEFYLADLVGLEAVGPEGEVGRVVAVHDYGAGTSLEIARAEGAPLLLPFTSACVPDVDISAGRLQVVPPAELDPTA
jgi:16S rRNA processing protein RimM